MKYKNDHGFYMESTNLVRHVGFRPRRYPGTGEVQNLEELGDLTRTTLRGKNL